MIGLVIKSSGKNSLVKAKNKVYKCTLRGNFRLENNFSNPIVSGDLVKIELVNNENGITVSYTHLTLPTTPYV